MFWSSCLSVFRLCCFPFQDLRSSAPALPRRALRPIFSRDHANDAPSRPSALTIKGFSKNALVQSARCCRAIRVRPIEPHCKWQPHFSSRAGLPRQRVSAKRQQLGFDPIDSGTLAADPHGQALLQLNISAPAIRDFRLQTACRLKGRCAECNEPPLWQPRAQGRFAAGLNRKLFRHAFGCKAAPITTIPPGCNDNRVARPTQTNIMKHGLHKLFIDELSDIHHAEMQLTRTLPQMAEAAENEELREAFESHLQQTENQIARIEQVFKSLGETPKKKKCKGMEGVIDEGKEMLKDNQDSASLDAALIAAAQKVEHYEIASYGCLCTWAELMDHQDALDLLKENLAEEKETDEKLTEIARAVANPEAAEAEED
jgi:ferritin-like metal-binding protein YciE